MARAILAPVPENLHIPNHDGLLGREFNLMFYSQFSGFRALAWRSVMPSLVVQMYEGRDVEALAAAVTVAVDAQWRKIMDLIVFYIRNRIYVYVALYWIEKRLEETEW